MPIHGWTSEMELRREADILHRSRCTSIPNPGLGQAPRDDSWNGGIRRSLVLMGRLTGL